MKLEFNCTVLYYNTPAFFHVSQIDNDEFLAEPLDKNMVSFKIKKRYGEWYGESETSHSMAIQIGKQIDKLLSLSIDEDIPGSIPDTE